MHYRIILLIAFVFASCRHSIRPIVERAEYDKYMNTVSTDSLGSLQRIATDMNFWMQRLKKNPEDAVAKASLAGLYSARFKIAGDIDDIHVSDRLYLIA